jgi:hypothetical protein
LHRSLVVLALVALAALASGCGDDDVQQADAGDTTTAPPPVGDRPEGPGDGAVAPPGQPEGECSGADIVTIAAMPQGVPDEVATTLVAIRSGAQRCDFEGLAELALEDGRFASGFDDEPGGPEALAAHWRAREEAGEPVTAVLVHLTLMEAVEVPVAGADGEEEEVLHVVPRAAHEDDDEARRAVIDAFGEEAEAWFAPEGYVGWRLAVAADGGWRWFVAGD